MLKHCAELEAALSLLWGRGNIWVGMKSLYCSGLGESFGVSLRALKQKNFYNFFTIILIRTRYRIKTKIAVFVTACLLCFVFCGFVVMPLTN